VPLLLESMPSPDKWRSILPTKVERARSAECAVHERVRGMRPGRVRINKTTLKRPDNANSASVEAVTANGTVLPLNAEKRAPEMGSTCHLLNRVQQRSAGRLTTTMYTKG